MRQTVSACALLSLTIACAAPPEMPDVETMHFEMFSRSARPNETGGGATANADRAAAALGLVGLAIHALTITPRLIYAGTVSQRPERYGEAWVFNKTMPLAGIEATLTASPNGEGWDTEMKVSGLRGELVHLDGFVWWRGHHEATKGNWLFFHPIQEAEALRVTWTRTAPDQRSLLFENLLEPDQGGGDTVEFTQDGNNLRLSVHDADGPEGEPRDLTVSWHAVDGNGRHDRFDGSSVCWATIDEGQIDLDVCP